MNRLIFERIEVGPENDEIEAVVLSPIVETFREWVPELVGPDWTEGRGRAGPSSGPGFDLLVAPSTYCMKVKPRFSLVQEPGFVASKLFARVGSSWRTDLARRDFFAAGSNYVRT